jgi:predicted HD phosphohydrolase
MVFSKEQLKNVFSLVEYTKGVEQGSDNHPEGDVYTHSMQCVAWAFRESIDTDLILAALCHDVGKAVETFGHEKHSVTLLGNSLSAKSLWLIQHHLRVRYLYEGEMKKLSKAHYLLYHPWLPDLVHLSRIDKLG